MINRIENVTIDGSNAVFGGFIYSVDYNLGLGGGETSSVNVSIISENGDYFISPEDLKTSGTPTEIRIGSKLVFYGYPISYRSENSSAGKILQVEYVEESCVWFDQTRIELKGRIGTTPVKTITATQDGTIRIINSGPVSNRIILVGKPFYFKQLAGREVRVSLTQNIADSSATILPGYVVISDNSDTSLLTLEDYAGVPEIRYSFPELIEAISSIVGVLPTLTENHRTYYRDYRGTLKETLSQWSSDLGLLFYWSNRKINFIDVRNPATFDIIKDKIDNIIVRLKPESVQESFTLRGTAVKAVTSNLLKNGQVTYDQRAATRKHFRFVRLRLDDILGLRQSWSMGGQSFLDYPWINWIRGAKYGNDVIALALCKGASTSSYSYFPSGSLPQNAVLAVIRMASDDTEYSYLKSEANTYFGINGEYIFFKVYTNVSGNPNIIESTNKALNKFRTLAGYMNRFKYFKISKTEYEREGFANSSVNWYHEDTALVETSIGKFLEPLAEDITNYFNLTIRGFIEQNQNFTVQSRGSFLESTGTLSGYAIAEIEPEWNPKSVDDIFDSRRVFKYEGTSDSSNVTSKIIYIGLALGSSEEGVILTQQNEIAALNAIAIETIQPPNEDGLDMYATGQERIFPYIEGKREFIKTSYCENYDTAQVERVDMDIFNMPEQLLADQVPLTNYGENYEDSLTQAHFDNAHNLIVPPLLYSQVKPFFSKTITLPYIDLPETVSVEDGLQSLSVSWGSNGLSATYTFGTERMSVPSPDFYLSSYYDRKAKEARNYLIPKVVIPYGSKVIY